MLRYISLDLLAGILAPIVTGISAFLIQRLHVKTAAQHSSEVEAIASAVEATAATVPKERREEEWEVVRRLVNEYPRPSSLSGEGAVLV